MEYPLVNIQKAMERSTIFHGKIHYFDWAIFNSKLLVHQRVSNQKEPMVKTHPMMLDDFLFDEKGGYRYLIIVYQSCYGFRILFKSGTILYTYLLYWNNKTAPSTRTLSSGRWVALRDTELDAMSSSSLLSTATNISLNMFDAYSIGEPVWPSKVACMSHVKHDGTCQSDHDPIMNLNKNHRTSHVPIGFRKNGSHSVWRSERKNTSHFPHHGDMFCNSLGNIHRWSFRPHVRIPWRLAGPTEPLRAHPKVKLFFEPKNRCGAQAGWSRVDLERVCLQWNWQKKQSFKWYLVGGIPTYPIYG